MKVRVHAPLPWIPLGLAVVVLTGWIAALPAAAQIIEEPELCARLLPCCPTPTQVVTYEELVACGFYPQETRLECIVNVKRPSCYGGNGIDASGSFEHVLFCVDWNNDGAFGQNEVVGEVTLQMHNESAGGAGPWSYAVYRDMVPPSGPRTSNGGVGLTTTQTNGPTFQARAILSYDTAPTGCSFIPQFGNVLNFPIRLDPIR